MKSNIRIKVEFLAGTSIEQAVIEAVRKAASWQVAYIDFDFNSVRMAISENTSVIGAVDKYHEALRSGKNHKEEEPIDPNKFPPKKNGACKNIVNGVCKQHNLFCGFPKCDEVAE